MSSDSINKKINSSVITAELIFFITSVWVACVVWVLCILLSVAVGSTASASCSPPLSKLIQKGGYGVSDTEGKIISSCNIDTPYVPASLFKIPTALAAFAILGPEYRFKTRFHMDNEDNLYIEGFGDPLLISEEIVLILDALKKRGVKRINAIFIDPANFALEHRVPGREDSDNPYDAPVGSTAVNFNSVAVRVKKKGRMKSRIVSAEEQTPTLPIMRSLLKGYPPGRFRINICKGNRRKEPQIARYTTELFRALQQKADIPGDGKTGIKPVPATARLVYEHYNSKNLKELTSSFLKYSSNFIANSVYLTCGAKKFGYPATWAKAERAVHEELVRQLGDKTAAAMIQKEGAGLYRGNRVTVRAMLKLLKAFRPHASLLRKYRGIPSKSGSMKGIYNYAGYLNNGNAYVILLNQTRNQRGPVLDLLKKGRFPKNEEKGKNKKKPLSQ
jgi:D-alanyl-D-alanine carboxypeptidase/D-alanyl-D-alanine-endopeptidase (penicillin-binding protein 4)